MNKYLIWILRIISAFILIQSTYFKLSGAPESIELFNAIGFGDTGRIALGVLELIAGFLLVTPKWSHWGAILCVGILAGAIMTHLTKIGIEFNNDGGALFGMAVVGFLCSAVLTFYNRKYFFGLIGIK